MQADGLVLLSPDGDGTLSMVVAMTGRVPEVLIKAPSKRAGREGERYRPVLKQGTPRRFRSRTYRPGRSSKQNGVPTNWTVVSTEIRSFRKSAGHLVAVWRGRERIPPTVPAVLKLLARGLSHVPNGHGKGHPEGRSNNSRELEAFYRITRIGALRRSLREMGPGLLREFCRALDFSRAEIFLIGHRRRIMHLHSSYGVHNQPVGPWRLTLKDCPFTLDLLRRRKVQHRKNICPDGEGASKWEWWGKVTSMFASPLRVKNRTIGTLYADRGGRPFDMTPAELDLASGLVSLMAEIIDASQAHQVQQKRHRQLDMLNRAAQMIGAEGRLPELTSRLAGLVRRQFGYDAVIIGLQEKSTGEIVVMAAKGQRASVKPGCRFQVRRCSPALCLGGRVFLSGKPLLIEDVMDLPRPPPEWPRGMRSILISPICSDRKIYGVIRMESLRPFAIDRGDEEIFSILGEQIGHAVRRSAVLESLHRKQADLRAVSERLEGALEEDRERIARELHDELAQSMTAVKFNLDMLNGLTNGGDARGPALIAETTALLDHSIAEIRRISMDLRPAMLDELGLLPTLRWYTGTYAQRTGIHVDLSADAAESRVRRDIELFFYRFIQEALTNVARHARARSVRISITRGDGEMRAVVSDDGVGMKEQGSRGDGLGLLGMRERIERLGGAFQLDSRRNRGTRLTVSIPLHVNRVSIGRAGRMIAVVGRMGSGQGGLRRRVPSPRAPRVIEEGTT